MPTTNAVPSADPSDLLFNAQKLDEVVNGTAESFVDRRGVERLTLTGALRLIGFEAPVAFTTGLSITRSTQTVTNGSNTYHADPASLPFTTTSTFNGAQWRLASNVTTFDLAAYAVPLVGGAGTIEMAKLTTAVQNLINGALQRSGGTMAAPLTLSGNVSGALQAVPLQQVQALAASALSFSALTLSATGANANVAVGAAELLLRGADGSPSLVSNINLTLNTAASGANGLDTGTLAASTWYAVWVISDGTTTASLLSLSGTAPTMPSGYTHRARVGWVRTDSTANKYPARFTQFGRRVDYAPATGTNLTAYPTLFSGSTSGPASLANFIPATAGVVRGLVQYSATNTASISSEDGAQLYIFDSGTGPAALRSPFEVITRTRAIVVGASGAAAGLVVGWEDNL